VTHTAEFASLVPAVAFSHRQFIVSALGIEFALSVQPVTAQTVIDVTRTFGIHLTG
jgi:hypothetical protein